MMRVTRGALLSLLLPACVPAVGPDETRPAARADAGSPAPAEPATPLGDDTGPLELSLDGAEPAPVAEVLPRVPERDLAPTHAERAAWSADGRAFVHCRGLPELDCTECRFVGRDGAAQSLEAGPACGEGAVPRATLDARLAEASLAAPVERWRDGIDVVIVVETREQETTNAGQPRPMLKLGARRRDSRLPPTWLLHVDPCQGCGTDQVCAAAAHLDALALSPDGEQLAVLIHQRGSQGDESMRVELLATARVAAAARAPASRAGP